MGSTTQYTIDLYCNHFYTDNDRAIVTYDVECNASGTAVSKSLDSNIFTDLI